MLRTCNSAKMLWALFILAGVLTGCQPVFADVHDARIQEIVDWYLPERMVSFAEDYHRRGGPKPRYYTEFLVLDLDGSDRAEYIVAAYTDSFSGAVRLLRLDGEGDEELVADPDCEIGGMRIDSIKTLDVDGDGRPEVLVSFEDFSGGVGGWLFKWTGTDLELVGPTVAVGAQVDTALYNAWFTNLDGDDDLEIVNGQYISAADVSDPDFEPRPPEIFDLVGGRYVKQGTVFLHTFFRGKGEPTWETSTFPVGDTESLYHVRIVNNEPDKQDRVDSAEVRLNGTTIAKPADFKKRDKELILGPFGLLPENELAVELRSSVGSAIKVIVEPVSEEN